MKNPDNGTVPDGDHGGILDLLGQRRKHIPRRIEANISHIQDTIANALNPEDRDFRGDLLD